ncbi:hypothetical protein [Methylophaga thalassica]|uniref:hypothetical protein n=1 Tax=Methylophaga thalassica TaxID=40223 RepID=UPI002E7B874C|nr:hypothetical protein [Methylophaga thalassica]WVI84924.1 hypothetical protein VSX76_14235 [Methylophaga thalassica]
MIKKETSKAVTTRFPVQDYLKLQQEAERIGCTIADVVRNAWCNHQQHNELKQQLLIIEQRQRKSTFEMLCAVVGLQADERKQAIEHLQGLGIKW